jgi:hypothetical protein
MFKAVSGLYAAAQKFYVDRVLLGALAVGFVLPLLLGSAFQFGGGLLAAIGLGVFFTASMLAVAVVLSLVGNIFKLDRQRMRKLIPLWVLLCWAASAGWLALASALLPSVISVSGWLGLAVGGLAMLITCVLTASKPGSCRGDSCDSQQKSS